MLEKVVTSCSLCGRRLLVEISNKVGWFPLAKIRLSSKAVCVSALLAGVRECVCACARACVSGEEGKKDGAAVLAQVS